MGQVAGPPWDGGRVRRLPSETGGVGLRRGISFPNEGDEIAEDDAGGDAGLAQERRSFRLDIIWEVGTSASDVDGTRHLLFRVRVPREGAASVAKGSLRGRGVGDDRAGGYEGCGGGVVELGSHASVGHPRCGVRGLRRTLSFPAALECGHVAGFSSGGIMVSEPKE